MDQMHEKWNKGKNKFEFVLSGIKPVGVDEPLLPSVCWHLYFMYFQFSFLFFFIDF